MIKIFYLDNMKEYMLVMRNINEVYRISLNTKFLIIQLLR